MIAVFFLFFSFVFHSVREIPDSSQSAGQADAMIVREYRKADPSHREKFHTVLSNFEQSARKVHLLCQRTRIVIFFLYFEDNAVRVLVLYNFIIALLLIF